MPRKQIDYSKTHFYKIVCKDISITDCYVGHTTDFTKGKNHHKRNCYNQKSKNFTNYVYQFIRENGGWDNFDMVIVKIQECENSLEARRIEREFVEQLQATLNRYVPYESEEEKAEEKKEWDKQYYQDRKEDLTNRNKQWYENNKDKAKEQRKERYENNKEATLEQNKKWRDEHKEEQKEYFKNYREKNKEKIKARAGEVIKCECGFTYTRHHKSRHFKTQHHQAYLNQQNEN